MQRLAYALALVAGVAACGGTSDPCDDPALGVVCQVGGTGEFAYNGDGKPATESHMYLPSAIRRGPDGLLYVMDYNNQRLRVIEDDGTMTTLAGDGFHNFATTGIPATESSLENPIDFAFLPDGELVFVSEHDPRVLRLDDGGVLRLVAGTGFVADTGDGGAAIDASFTELQGIAVAGDGTIYVADGGANRVRVIRDGIVDAFAGTGEAGSAGDGGAATAAQLDYPTAVEVAGDGSVLIADSKNHAVRRVGSDGTITTLAGIGSQGFTGDDGPATAAELAAPSGLALDGDGGFYIADQLNFRVRHVDAAGIIATVAGTGARGFSGNGSQALDAEFNYLSRISLDGGELYVADQGNSCVRSIRVE